MHTATPTTTPRPLAPPSRRRTRFAPSRCVLDLGDGIGALIVHTDPELLGVEIEISPAGDDGQRQHKEVLQRVWAGTVNVLVYDNLPRAIHPLARRRRLGAKRSNRQRLSCRARLEKGARNPADRCLN